MAEVSESWLRHLICCFKEAVKARTISADHTFSHPPISCLGSRGAKLQKSRPLRNPELFILIQRDRCRPPHPCVEIREAEEETVEFLERTLYLFIHTILYPTEFKGRCKDAYKKRGLHLKSESKNDLRKRTRQTELMLDDLLMTLTSFTFPSLPSHPLHPEVGSSVILPSFCSVQ